MPPKTPKNRITENERLQLIGLMTLAHDYSRKLDAVMEAAASIIEEPEFWGTHLGDAFYDYRGNTNADIDQLLDKMGIVAERDLKKWTTKSEQE